MKEEGCELGLWGEFVGGCNIEEDEE